MRRRRKRRAGQEEEEEEEERVWTASDRSTAVTNRGTGKQGNRQESLARGVV